MGLNPSEMAFFNLFKRDLGPFGIENNSDLVKFTYKVLEVIEPLYTLVDWHKKENIHKEIKRESKKILWETGMRRPQLDIIVQEILKLAITHYSK